MPKVSVILPTYNRVHVLPRALASALNQTVHDLEVLVVDDGSDDDTAATVAAMRDPRICYLPQDHRGGAPAARNIGLEAARGRWVAFLDSDDEWLPDKLQRQIAALHRWRSEGVGVSTCGWQQTRNGSTQAVVGRREKVPRDELLAFAAGPWSGPTILLEASDAVNSIRFDEGLSAGQDWDFLVRLAAEVSIRTVQIPLVQVHRASGEHVGTLERKLAGRLRLRAKYATELQEKPWALARHELGIALAYSRLGKVGKARPHLVAAAHAQARDTRIWLALMASYFGERACRIGLRFALSRPVWLKKYIVRGD